ncbi:MAG TPA: hypothetical protein VIL94_11700 [Acidothermaceae bacterium]
MEHVVFFPAPDGTPAFRRLASLDDAARFVEHLRNVENVSEASVHTLTEVPLSFKAWYRVELPDAEATQPEATSTDLDTEAEVASSRQLEIPAPATIAEAISLYQQDEAASGRNVELPEAVGSSTGITVPDRDFAPREQQYAYANGPEQAATATNSGAPLVADQRGFASVASPEPGEAQVLEPIFGSRRERGIGYFAR